MQQNAGVQAAFLIPYRIQLERIRGAVQLRRDDRGERWVRSEQLKTDREPLAL